MVECGSQPLSQKLSGVLIKGNGKIMRKAENRSLLGLKTQQEIARRVLLGSSAIFGSPSGRGDMRVGRQALVENGLITSLKSLDLIGR